MNTCQARIGYARTSTTDQNLEARVSASKAAGCGMVRTERKSGAVLDGRPELGTILDFIHPGETLVVTRIDRLARSLGDRQAEGIAAAKKRGVCRGRIPKIDMAAIRAKLAEGLSPTQIARDMGISRGTVYKAKAQMPAISKATGQVTP